LAACGGCERARGARTAALRGRARVMAALRGCFSPRRRLRSAAHCICRSRRQKKKLGGLRARGLLPKPLSPCNLATLANAEHSQQGMACVGASDAVPARAAVPARVVGWAGRNLTCAARRDACAVPVRCVRSCCNRKSKGFQRAACAFAAAREPRGDGAGSWNLSGLCRSSPHTAARAPSAGLAGDTAGATSAAPYESSAKTADLRQRSLAGQARHGAPTREANG